MQAEQQESMAKNEENVMLIQKLEDTITKSQLEISALNNKVISGQNGLLREVFFSQLNVNSLIYLLLNQHIKGVLRLKKC